MDEKPKRRGSDLKKAQRTVLIALAIIIIGGAFTIAGLNLATYQPRLVQVEKDILLSTSETKRIDGDFQEHILSTEALDKAKNDLVLEKFKHLKEDGTKRDKMIENINKKLDKLLGLNGWRNEKKTKFSKR